MKKLLSIICCLLVLSACNQKKVNEQFDAENLCSQQSYTDIEREQEINSLYGLVDSCDWSYAGIKYKEKVNGYEVFVKVLRDSIHDMYKSDLVGRNAVLYFRKGEPVLIIMDSSYADTNLFDYFNYYSDYSKSDFSDKYGKILEVDYVPLEMTDNSFKANVSPFFFFDVDFDGEEELVICLWGNMGYREHNAYEAYKINVGDGCHQLSPMQEPFNGINDYTRFDVINKQIEMPQGIGVKMPGCLKVYGVDETAKVHSIELKEVLKYDWNHAEGVKYVVCDPTIYHYKVVNGKEILDRIEKCPNDTLK